MLFFFHGQNVRFRGQNFHHPFHVVDFLQEAMATGVAIDNPIFNLPYCDMLTRIL